jgi:hypothetical protein
MMNYILQPKIHPQAPKNAITLFIPDHPILVQLVRKFSFFLGIPRFITGLSKHLIIPVLT